MKKILYIKAQGLGDMIGGIPFLVQQKELGNEVYQTFYDMRYVNRGLKNMTKEQQKEYKKLPMYHGRQPILETIKKSGLVEDIIFIPYGIIPLLKFFFRYLKHFDQAIIPIKTLAAQVIATICARETKCIFSGVNDISKFRILSQGECDGYAPQALNHYWSKISRPLEEVAIQGKYITIFPSIFERSPDMPQRKIIMQHILALGYQIVLIGGAREQRFTQELSKSGFDTTNIINYIEKTSIAQASYIMKNASYTISCNGGQMWIANLVNPRAINIHTVSSYLTEPPVDNKMSFNIRKYHYKECQPCEAGSTPYSGRIPNCVFYNTNREGECRKPDLVTQIIYIIKNVKSHAEIN